jgi:hypothetical protein
VFEFRASANQRSSDESAAADGRGADLDDAGVVFIDDHRSDDDRDRAQPDGSPGDDGTEQPIDPGGDTSQLSCRNAGWHVRDAAALGCRCLDDLAVDGSRVGAG